MSSHCLGSGDPSCMVLPRYCRFRRASHLHSQPTPLSLFSREALYSVRDARSTTDRLANLSSCPPLLISTTCLSLLLSHHQQSSASICSHSRLISFANTLLWKRQWQLPLEQDISACRYCCSTLSKSHTISIGKDTNNTITMSFLSKLKIPHLAVRGIQVFFSLLVLILSAYGTSDPTTTTSPFKE